MTGVWVDRAFEKHDVVTVEVEGAFVERFEVPADVHVLVTTNGQASIALHEDGPPAAKVTVVPLVRSLDEPDLKPSRIAWRKILGLANGRYGVEYDKARFVVELERPDEDA